MQLTTAPGRNNHGPRLRRFTITINNWTDEEYHRCKIWLEHHAKWAVLGKEHQEDGTPHIQGACVLARQLAFATVKSAFPRAHIETMRGTPLSNLTYCTKEDTNAWQFGEIPEQGKRSDLQDVAELIQNDKATLRQVAEHYPTAVIKYSKGLSVLRSLQSSQRNPSNPPKVYWFYGPTGTGKTRAAWDYGCTTYGKEDTLILPDSTLHWFDQFDGQKCVIIDDFRAKGTSFATVLRVLDRYPLTVPIKGAFVNWNPECIIITTPGDIPSTFSKRAEHIPEDIRQLERRVTKSVLFPVRGKLQDVLSGGLQLRLDDDRGDRPVLVRSNATVTQCMSCGECMDSSIGGYCKTCRINKNF